MSSVSPAKIMFVVPSILRFINWSTCGGLVVHDKYMWTNRWIIESSRWEKIFRIFKSNHQSDLPCPITKPWPFSAMSLQYFQRWGLHQFPVQPIPMLDHPVYEHINNTWLSFFLFHFIFFLFHFIFFSENNKEIYYEEYTFFACSRANTK